MKRVFFLLAPICTFQTKLAYILKPTLSLESNKWKLTTGKYWNKQEQLGFKNSYAHLYLLKKHFKAITLRNTSFSQSQQIFSCEYYYFSTQILG